MRAARPAADLHQGPQSRRPVRGRKLSRRSRKSRAGAVLLGIQDLRRHAGAVWTYQKLPRARATATITQPSNEGISNANQLVPSSGMAAAIEPNEHLAM